ncbi:hypothetical protein D3C85_922000 [compost metagenome]
MCKSPIISPAPISSEIVALRLGLHHPIVKHFIANIPWYVPLLIIHHKRGMALKCRVNWLNSIELEDCFLSIAICNRNIVLAQMGHRHLIQLVIGSCRT